MWQGSYCTGHQSGVVAARTGFSFGIWRARSIPEPELGTVLLNNRAGFNALLLVWDYCMSLYIFCCRLVGVYIFRYFEGRILLTVWRLRE